MPLEVDDDVELVAAHAFGDGEVAQIIDVNEMLAGGTNPLLQGGPIGDAVGIQEGLEARAVAPFEKFDDQLRGGVLAKIRREVADANPSRTARSADRRWRKGLEVAGDAATAQFADAALLRRRRIERDQSEGGQQAAVGVVGGIERGQQRGRVFLKLAPVTRIAAVVEHERQRSGADTALIERNRRTEALGGLARHAEVAERQSQTVMHDGAVDALFERLHQRIDSLAVTACQPQYIAVLGPKVVIAR